MFRIACPLQIKWENHMPSYQIHTIASAPEKSRPVLEQLQQAFGFIPNLAAAISNSPKLLTAFAAVFQQVHSSSLTEQEIQVVLLTDAVANSSPCAACAQGPAIWRSFHPGEDAHREARAPERTGARRIPRRRLHQGTDPGGHHRGRGLDHHQL